MIKDQDTGMGGGACYPISGKGKKTRPLKSRSTPPPPVEENGGSATVALQVRIFLLLLLHHDNNNNKDIRDSEIHFLIHAYIL